MTRSAVYAQSKDDLERQKSVIEDDINYTNNLLDQTRSEKKTSMNRLYLINNNIKQRNKKIRNYSYEIRLINKDIITMSDSIEVLQSTLENLQEEYAEMIVSTWHNKNIYKRLSYIFDSKDLTQAFKRIAFFKTYSEKRKSYYEKISNITTQLQQKQISYETSKSKKESLVQSEKLEKTKLEQDRKSQNQLVQDLSKKEKQLKKKIAQQQSQLKKLNAAIESLIANEIKSRGGSKNKLDLTPEEKLLSDRFGGNKSRLPWPCERGVVSRPYGTQPHPVLKNIKIDNPGINILTEENSMARSIFKGVVVKVQTINQFKAVIIRHGEYLTVYSNLENVIVQQGDNVDAKQPLGRIIKDADGTTELHFEIWKGSVKQNPALWLAQP